MLDKILAKFILNDLKTGKPSYTVTAFVVGFWIINIKLLLSGMQFSDKIKMSEFSGMDYATAAAAIGSIYVLRKNKTIEKDKTEKDQ